MSLSFLVIFVVESDVWIVLFADMSEVFISHSYGGSTQIFSCFIIGFSV